MSRIFFYCFCQFLEKFLKTIIIQANRNSPNPNNKDMKRVAIQGGLGAYHGIAAENFFDGEQVEIIPCIAFRDIFSAIKKDSNVIGIMAIENTIAGSLLPNYELLKLHKLPIAGEYKLRVSHCLAALPGQKWWNMKIRLLLHEI